MAQAISFVNFGGLIRVVITGSDPGRNGTKFYKRGDLMVGVTDDETRVWLSRSDESAMIISFLPSECLNPLGSGYDAVNLAQALGDGVLSDGIGNLDASTAGSLIARLASAVGVLDAINAGIAANPPVITNSDKFVLESTAPAGSWTSDALVASGMRSCSFVGAISSSGATTGVFQWQGSNDGTDFWVNAGDASSMSGHGDGAIGFSYTGATSYLFMRLVFTSSGSVQQVTGTIAIVK